MKVLVIHNRYRTYGGEERAVQDQIWLMREYLGLDVELLERNSDGLSRRRAAAGLLRGGLDQDAVASAVRGDGVVRRSGLAGGDGLVRGDEVASGDGAARGAAIVHAHNIHPTFGWRALAAARAAGAHVVLHLHNYRLVCAVGTCVRDGADCTACHGRNTVPGVLHGCRGSRGEALVYGAALATWQRRVLESVDTIVVPSEFARARLRALGVPLASERVRVIPHFVRRFAEKSRAASGEYALVVARLAPEKGVDVAIRACAQAGRPLVVAGDGPERAALEQLARVVGERVAGEVVGDRSALAVVSEGGAVHSSERALVSDEAAVRSGGVRFVGRVDAERLWELRRGAAVELVPTRAAETFGLAALEAQAAAVPVVATRMGALPELLPAAELVAAGSAAELAAALQRVWGVEALGAAGLQTVRQRYAVASIAPRYAELHALVSV